MKSTVIDTVTTRLPIAAQAMPGGIIHQCCKQASVQLAVEVCVDGRVDAQAYCSFAAADAVNLYAAVLHKSVMRVDIFYASDNFFRLHKSFLL